MLDLFCMHQLPLIIIVLIMGHVFAIISIDIGFWGKQVQVLRGPATVRGLTLSQSAHLYTELYER